MSPAAERAERLLAVPTAANVWAALDELNAAMARAEVCSPAQLTRVAALLNNALAIRVESLRLRSGAGVYSPDGHWESPAGPARVVAEG